MFVNKLHEEAYDLAKKGQLEDAIALFNEALTIHPGHPDIYSDRAVTYLHLKMKVESLQDFDLCIEIQPDYSYRYASRAYAKDFFGDTEGAIADYEKAIQLDPEDAVAHNNLGLLQEKLGYNRKAKENFERADRLSKIENRLYEVMNELENPPQNENIENQNSMDINESNSYNLSEPNSSQEFKRIFTSRSQFQEFLRFVKNGFKLK
jgi:tetratricopeptide (TPR) repeat protein